MIMRLNTSPRELLTVEGNAKKPYSIKEKKTSLQSRERLSASLCEGMLVGDLPLHHFNSESVPSLPQKPNQRMVEPNVELVV
jgi:hypothetical protein